MSSKVGHRDELDEIHSRLLSDAKQHSTYANDEESALYGYSEGAEHALDTVRLLGYTKPRTVETFDELEALADGSAVLDSDHDVSTKHDGKWHGYEMNPLDSRKFKNYGPFTVLWEPEAAV